MMSTPEVEPSPQQPAYLDAPQTDAVIRPLPAEVAATDAVTMVSWQCETPPVEYVPEKMDWDFAPEPYAMLPLCHTCGQRVPHGSATHSGERWHCMRCWGGWLAGAPEPVTHEHQSGGELTWPAEESRSEA